MASVFDVADFFVQMANQSEDDQMTNLKVNKLLYYAQGAFLARTGIPLFDNQIETWNFGPVVAEIYHKYKVCGRNPISSDGDIDRSRFTAEEFDVLMDVMREFGQYTGAALVSFTHRPGTPWSNAREKNAPILSQSDIKDYFTEHPIPYLKDRIVVPEVDKLPESWYDSEEDAEWEAYL